MKQISFFLFFLLIFKSSSLADINKEFQKWKTDLQTQRGKTNSTALFDAGKRKRTGKKKAVNLETSSYQFCNRGNESGNNNEGRTAARNAKQNIYRN